MKTNQQVIDLWRSLFPSIKKDSNKLVIKSRGQTFSLNFTKTTAKTQFSKNNQYR